MFGSGVGAGHKQHTFRLTVSISFGWRQGPPASTDSGGRAPAPEPARIGESRRGDGSGGQREEAGKGRASEGRQRRGEPAGGGRRLASGESARARRGG